MYTTFNLAMGVGLREIEWEREAECVRERERESAVCWTSNAPTEVRPHPQTLHLHCLMGWRPTLSLSQSISHYLCRSRSGGSFQTYTTFDLALGVVCQNEIERERV